MLETKQTLAYKTLMNGLTKNRISHAYLFEGEKGTPKYDMAMLFAKKLLCENDGCNTCDICRRIDHGNYPNLQIIEPDGATIKKEQIVELQKEFNKTLVEGYRKIYIIKDCDKMSTSAANSLLKFLEEPYPNTHAILITDSIQKILKTIKSRCQIISFQPLNLDDSSKQYRGEYRETNTKLAILLSKNSEEIKDILKDDNLNKQIDSIIAFTREYENRKYEAIVSLKDTWLNTFNDKLSMLLGLEMLFYFYNDVMSYKYLNKINVYNDYQELIGKIALQDEDIILIKIEAILKAINKCNSNVNSNLLMEQLIIEMKGGIQ